MKKKDLIEVIKVLIPEKTTGISLDNLLKNAGLNKNEALEAIEYMEVNKWIIVSKNKDGISLTKRSDIDYFLLLNKIKTTKAENAAIKNAVQILIGLFITIVGGLILYYLSTQIL